jgi:plasmid stability protein
MPTLHVRNVPDELYERLRRRAAAAERSRSAEVVVLLQRALRHHAPEETALFDRIERRRARIERVHGGPFPSSVGLIREDRDR